jgi:pimeloyl-ACP methyl ester carboxylesterase
VPALRSYVTAIGVAAVATAAAAQSAPGAVAQEGLKHATVTGTKLAYVEAGQGAPIVFVHGAFGDYREWAQQIAAGSEDFHVVAYSRRDFHPNSRDSDKELQTADRDVVDLIELVESLDLEPVHLVGHSAGGHAALAAAIRRPDLVRSLVLEEGGFVSDHEQSTQALEEISAVSQRYLEYRAAGKREAAVEHFIDFVSGTGSFASSSPTVKQLLMDNEAAFGVRSNAPLTCSETASLEPPVLVVLGERSPPFIGRLMSGLLDCLRDEKTVRIPGASHDVHTAAPEAFNRAVFEFISGQ